MAFNCVYKKGLECSIAHYSNDQYKRFCNACCYECLHAIKEDCDTVCEIVAKYYRFEKARKVYDRIKNIPGLFEAIFQVLLSSYGHEPALLDDVCKLMYLIRNNCPPTEKVIKCPMDELEEYDFEDIPDINDNTVCIRCWQNILESKEM